MMLISKKTVAHSVNVARERIATNPNRDNNKVDLAMLLPLAEMAALDIAPDGTFGDNECLAWEAFRYAIELSNGQHERRKHNGIWT